MLKRTLTRLIRRALTPGLTDHGKATKVTKALGPPERLDNPIIKTKSPYLG